MMDERDPPRLRLSGDSPSELVQALEFARLDVPGREDLVRLEAGVVTAVAVPEASGDASSSELSVTRRRRSMRPLAAGATTSFKLLLAAAVAASGLGAGLWMFATTPREAAPRAATPPAPAVTAARPAVRPSQEVVPFEVQEAAPSNAVDAPRNEPRANLPVPPDRPDQKAKALSSADSQGPNGMSPPVGAAAFGDPGATEVSLLGRAQQALTADPGSALALTAEHARSFPHGALAQEREFIAIEALEALGRHAEAVARATRFRTDYPSSAHLRRLDPLLGIPTHAAP